MGVPVGAAAGLAVMAAAAGALVAGALVAGALVAGALVGPGALVGALADTVGLATAVGACVGAAGDGLLHAVTTTIVVASKARPIRVMWHSPCPFAAGLGYAAECS